MIGSTSGWTASCMPDTATLIRYDIHYTVIVCCIALANEVGATYESPCDDETVIGK